jgi:PAS domain S-box-containing protein
MISVLYVDDEPDYLDLCKWYLERTKEFTVTTASSASGALDLIPSHAIHAIVSDYQMPGMDGIGLLKQVRATDKTIPFIMFTGRGREEIAVEAFENGADFYLQKGGAPTPQFAELMHKIKAAVEHRRADMQVTTLNRLYTVLSATNKAIVHIHDKTALLGEICRITVDTGGFTMAWAGLINPENNRIDPVAAAGHGDSYLDAISFSGDDPPGQRSPTETAFHTGTYTVCNDTGSHPSAAPWRSEALLRGYCSIAAFPFAQGTTNAGVITFCASEPGFFNNGIIRLLDEQSQDISFALQNLDHEAKRTAAEQELKKSELRYRRLFETAQDAILILDGESGEIIDANTFILDMLGYPLEYFVGKHLWELGFLKDKSFALEAFEKLKTEGYIRYEDLPLETKAGKAINVEFVSNVYLVDDRRIIQCNIRDITRRKAAQDKLQASETRYRRLFETAQDGILILDGKSGQIVDANPFILDMLGYPLEYFLGKQLWELGFIRDKSFAEQAFRDLKTNGYIRYEDLPLETRDRQGINVEFISNVYTVDHHEIIQCNIRNITARKRAEDALALTSRKLNLLSSITRHDINNQLTALSGYLELLHKKVPAAARFGYFTRMTDAVARISTMIRFAREYEQIGVNAPSWQDCRILVDTAVRDVSPGDVMVNNDIPAGTCMFADPLIVKVFYNLMQNAVQHGGKITSIRFFVENRDGVHVVVCEDDGDGIAAGEKEQIFERGFGKNTGLGLTISREILSITGITIRETGEPKKGARFEIEVPEGAFRSGGKPVSGR